MGKYDTPFTSLASKKIFFFDKDGTLTLGNQALPGALAIIDYLLAKRILFYVITNNSSKTPSRHSEAFNKVGLPIKSNRILVSSQIACSYLLGQKLTDVFLLANDEVVDFFMSKGIRHNSKSPKAILLTYDTELTYRKIETVTRLIHQGIPYFATHADLVCPTEAGDIPDIGLIINMLEVTTNVKPLKIFGKPSPDFIDYTLRKHHLQRSDAVIIGDRLYTDIFLANTAGIMSILVLTGETTRDTYSDSEINADIVVDNLSKLVANGQILS